MSAFHPLQMFGLESGRDCSGDAVFDVSLDIADFGHELV